MKGIFKKLDSYISKARKIGTSKDYSSIDFELLDNNTLKTLYSADGIGKKIIDIKSKDMIREWIDIEKDTDGQILDALNDIDVKTVLVQKRTEYDLSDHMKITINKFHGNGQKLQKKKANFRKFFRPKVKK